MKICVLIASEGQIDQAGARIRYRRIGTHLQEFGHELRLVPIQLATANYDAYIISKCFDARSLVLARVLAGRRPVGVDIFDDYFSQTGDSRLTGRRQWLKTLSTLADFVLCSTPDMLSLVTQLLPQTPAHMLLDPYPEVDFGGIGSVVARKLDDLYETRILNIAWFGMGDNPLFSVGISDLARFGSELGLLRARGWEPQLRVLTNSRAMTTTLLSMIRRLPVSYTLEEWSEKRELDLLKASMAAFFPVNGQNFSVVKSLNRAITALCSGTQVLSAGYPLYEPLSPFVYRDPNVLLDDVEKRTLALRGETIPQFTQLVDQLASPAGEARSLVDFLVPRCDRHSSRADQSCRPLAAVLHGPTVSNDIHMFIQRMGGLSVSSPLCKSELNFDLSFSVGADGQVEALIAERWYDTLSSDVQLLLSPPSIRGGSAYYPLKLSYVFPRMHRLALVLRLFSDCGIYSAAYMQGMAGLSEALEFLFPGISCYYSDDSMSFGLSSVNFELANGME